VDSRRLNRWRWSAYFCCLRQLLPIWRCSHRHLHHPTLIDLLVLASLGSITFLLRNLLKHLHHLQFSRRSCQTLNHLFLPQKHLLLSYLLLFAPPPCPTAVSQHPPRSTWPCGIRALPAPPHHSGSSILPSILHLRYHNNGCSTPHPNMADSSFSSNTFLLLVRILGTTW
jgi:hypothetical protein